MEEFVEGLMEKVGISKEQADKVMEFIQENASKLPEILKSTGIAGKLGGLGDMLGGGGDDDGDGDGGNPLSKLF